MARRSVAGDLASLSRPVWSALTTAQAGWTTNNKLARAYPPDVSRFADIVDDSEASRLALREIVRRQGPVVTFRTEGLAQTPGLIVSDVGTAIQLVARSQLQPGAPTPPGLIRLGLKDVPEMTSLVELAKPGPFLLRTIELGHYVGIRRLGQLVAMAGERMRLRHFTEISAVAVHPDYRGAGLAQQLVVFLMQQIFESGSIPFLHVFEGNLAAIKLYRKLGFTDPLNLFVQRVELSADLLALPYGRPSSVVRQ